MQLHDQTLIPLTSHYYMTACQGAPHTHPHHTHPPYTHPCHTHPRHTHTHTPSHNLVTHTSSLEHLITHTRYSPTLITHLVTHTRYSHTLITHLGTHMPYHSHTSSLVHPRHTHISSHNLSLTHLVTHTHIVTHTPHHSPLHLHTSSRTSSHKPRYSHTSSHTLLALIPTHSLLAPAPSAL